MVFDVVTAGVAADFCTVENVVSFTRVAVNVSVDVALNGNKFTCVIHLSWWNRTLSSVLHRLSGIQRNILPCVDGPNVGELVFMVSSSILKRI